MFASDSDRVHLARIIEFLLFLQDVGGKYDSVFFPKDVKIMLPILDHFMMRSEEFFSLISNLGS